MKSEGRIDRLTRLRYRNAIRLGRREKKLEAAREVWLRQQVRRGHVEDCYQLCIELVIEARALGDAIRSALREEV